MKIFLKNNNNKGVMSDPSFNFFFKIEIWKKMFLSLLSNFYKQNKMRNGLLKKERMT